MCAQFIFLLFNQLFLLKIFLIIIIINIFSGTRLRNDSLLMIYYHDQTIAVTELGPDKILLSCELIEI